jgi:hypothetical protein
MRHFWLIPCLVALLAAGGCASRRPVACSGPDLASLVDRNAPPPEAPHSVFVWMEEHKAVTYTGLGLVLVAKDVALVGAVLLGGLVLAISAGGGLAIGP